MKKHRRGCTKRIVLLVMTFLTMLLIGCNRKGVEGDAYLTYIKEKFTIVKEEDTHGGFHGDGMYFLELDCSDEKENALELVSGWKKVPFSQNIEIMLYGGDSDRVVYKSEIAAEAKIPRIENGYYYFCDRHSESTASSDDMNLFSRASYNFTIVIYDADNHRMYYLKYDT